MPTPAKLVAALAMALVGWATAEALVRFVLEDGARPGYRREVAALLGLALGWRMLGRAATGPRGKGDGMTRAITSGFATAVVLGVLAVLLQVGHDTLDDVLAGRIFGIGRTVEAVVDGILAHASALIEEPRVLGVLLGGGALAGLAAGGTGRVWW